MIVVESTLTYIENRINFVSKPPLGYKKLMKPPLTSTAPDYLSDPILSVIMMIETQLKLYSFSIRRNYVSQSCKNIHLFGVV